MARDRRLPAADQATASMSLLADGVRKPSVDGEATKKAGRRSGQRRRARPANPPAGARIAAPAAPPAPPSYEAILSPPPYNKALPAEFAAAVLGLQQDLGMPVWLLTQNGGMTDFDWLSDAVG